MIKKENIICISSIDWDFNWQGHQEIMAILASNGNRVLFIENTGVRVPGLKDIGRLRKRFVNWYKSIKGFRKEMNNLYVYSPVILPFPYSRIARWISRYMLIKPLRRWMKVMEFHDPIVWTFLPTGIALDIINNIDRKLLVYYCIADFSQLVDNPRKIIKTENALIKLSDLIFVQGKVLEDKCKRFNDNVYIIPFGVKFDTFENFFNNFPGKANAVPEDIRNIKKPIIGYAGGIHRHIDLELVSFIARKRPEWSMVFIGPVQTDIVKLRDLPNIFFLGKKAFSSLPNYMNEFAAAIIPYDKTGYTETVRPNKLDEYHAMGKPVVSTDLPEINHFNIENNNLVSVAKTYEEFTNCLEKILKGEIEGSVNQRVTSARKSSWDTKMEQINNLLEEALEKKTQGPVNWQEKLLKFYKATQKKMCKISAIVLTIYLLLFYTPIVWLIANPLKISQPPEKADCIVVFAGGVGESGKAGQGYEERVQQAVQLYKNGYAQNMIFSSGYLYVFKEPLVMKSLAISLGIPEEAIILEDRAKNTYENVKFTKEIITDRGWDKILLISSEYHMRRVSLVAKKIAPEIETIYTPVTKSRFYRHGIGPNGKSVWKQTNLRQIRGLMHEYLGIVYYFMRGYI